jgi:hypothetical protein
MQLTGKTSIRGALTAITAALLGTGAAHAAGDNHVASSLLLYSETNRVQAAEGIVSITRMLKHERILNAKFTLDGLTGASPNGATPSSNVQTFTRPSGGTGYTVEPGKLPLDKTFKDSRYAFDGSLTQPINRLTSVIFGAHLSTEHDYNSFGANVGFTRDFNRKNTTLAASVAASHDIVRPIGSAPTPFASMAAPTGGIGGEGEDDGGRHHREPGKGKNVVDAVVSLTQVLNRRTIVRFNYSYNHSSGYLNDPYKLLSVVQGPSGTDPGEPVDYLYESRPGSQTKHAVYAELRRYIVKDHTFDLSYRYFWDDWGTKSKTVDFFYHLPLPGGHALQPHVRWYRQTAADFYRSYLLQNSPLPTYASADYRLAPFHALTLGLEYLFPIAEGEHLSVSAEYYRQFGDLSPPSSLGILSRSNLFPEMKAVMVRVGFTHDF